jgi:hypothetical protein
MNCIKLDERIIMCGDLKNIKVVTAYFKAVTDIYPEGLRKTMKNLSE